MNIEEVREFITSQIRKSGRQVIFDRHMRSVKILCPFHQERNPSLNMALNHKKLFPGTFICPSCNTHGSWNKFAEKLDLEQITQEHVAEVDPFYQLHGLLTPPDAKSIALPKGVVRWKHGEWRGLSERFLTLMGAYRWWDDMAESYRILLPVYNHKELQGYIGARTDSKTTPKYRNSPGEWAKTTWFGFDYADCLPLHKAWEHYDYQSVAIVEGPYDALRCWYYGIPALGMLGTNNWSDIKLAKLSSLGVKRVVLFFDGDEAGRAATKEIYKQLKSLEGQNKSEVIIKYKLPWYLEKEDQIDPGNCRLKYLKEVKELLYVR